MTDATPATVVGLRWEEGLRFTATSKDHAWTLDGRNEAGPGPVIIMASALAGCMAIDVVHILTRGRHKVAALDAELVGQRADTDPKRFTRVELLFKVTTSAPIDAVERAIDLSRGKYCSVWQSMRQDIEFVTSAELTSTGG
ncbi:MAG: OsmC family protein [Acidobacteriota bacterium]